ncbi:Mak32 protein [Candida orthopsilosis Co 90-125]|uniref:Mak32 protein n=1 Tax=Candida orthopsilosis (strain 90-125) TaxID=1136231 RepID=H8X0I8_CANO9|nr:Mak32 protein [Candida orthopsilosis Co 90-125]CCG22700.1 Mak32 protein [Candida orthopsilosis Co 90-125]
MTILTTLGMFIIDENQYIDPPAPKKTNIIGGAGTYAIIGARIVSSPKLGHQISGIIDEGTDFPVEVHKEIESWQTGVIFRRNNHRLTTRGVNTYVGGIRHFHYQTEKRRIQVEDVFQYDKLKYSKCYHLICSIDRCRDIIEQINEVNPNAKYIYEPLPDDCVASNYDKLQGLLPLIDIFTPNLDEARAFFRTDDPDSRELCSKFTQFQKIPNSGTVIRCGADGCCISTIDSESFKLPAYHQNQADVIDVTGGGNSFCGGFIMGWYLSQGDWLVGGICGNIASGCIIERLGMPKVSEDGWKLNGKSLRERVDTYLRNNSKLDVKLNWL